MRSADIGDGQGAAVPGALMPCVLRVPGRVGGGTGVRSEPGLAQTQGLNQNQGLTQNQALNQNQGPAPTQALNQNRDWTRTRI